MTATVDGSGDKLVGTPAAGGNAGLDMVDIEGAVQSSNNNIGNGALRPGEAGAIDMSLHPSGIIPTLQYGSFPSSTPFIIIII